MAEQAAQQNMPQTAGELRRFIEALMQPVEVRVRDMQGRVAAGGTGDVYAQLGQPAQTVIGARGPGGESGISFGIADDTNLYRSGANALKTDDQFQAAGDVVGQIGAAGQTVLGARGPSGQAGLQFGSAADANLYRRQQGCLATDGQLHVQGSGLPSGGAPGLELQYYGGFASPGGVIFAYDRGAGAPMQLYLQHTGGNVSIGSDTAPPSLLSLAGSGSGSGLTFGHNAANPANLYRAGADLLRTDDSLHVIGSEFLATGTGAATNRFTVSNNIYIGSSTLVFHDGTNFDTVLYRAAADTLQTDDRFWASLGIIARKGGSAQVNLGANGPSGEAGITFGLAEDTNLYRYAADKLATDDDLLVMKQITSNKGNPAGTGMANAVLAFAYSGSFEEYRHNIRTQHDSAGQATNLMNFYLWKQGTDAAGTLGSRKLLSLRGDGVAEFPEIAQFDGDAYFVAQAIGKQLTDSNPRWRLRQDVGGVAGKPGLELGDGTAGVDTNLYRDAANLLRTDDSVIVGPSSSGNMRIDNSGFRDFWQSEANERVRLSRDAAGSGVAGLLLGAGGASAPDVNLYRSAANVLKTDDNFVVGGGTLTIGTTDITGFGTAGTISGQNQAGSASTAARSDHNHQLPNLGTYFPTLHLQGAASAAVGAVNKQVYGMVVVPHRATITGVGYWVGATASGNVKAGLFDSAGTKVAETTATVAQAGASTFQKVAFATPYVAAPGVYFVALVFSSATATTFQVTSIVPFGNATLGAFSQPASITVPTAPLSTTPATVMTTY